MKNSDTLDSRLCKYHRELSAFCSRYKRIFLYGAGKACPLVLNLLRKENIKVHGILVSDGHMRDKFIDSVPVYETSQIHLSEIEDGIILAVRPNLQTEIMTPRQIYGLSNNVYTQRSIFVNKDRGPDKRRLLSNPLSPPVEMLPFPELDKIGCQTDTDKSSLWHDYLRKYEIFLHLWKDRSFTLLELGVYKGASVKMWKSYFPHAKILGVDIDVACKQYAEDNLEIVNMDLSSLQNLETLKQYKAAIIVDDASHLWSHQIKALFTLFSALPHGGIYILEDIDTSFFLYRDMGYDDATVSTYDILSAIAEVVTSHELLNLEKHSATVCAFTKEIETIAMQIDMIVFIHSSCLMVKR